jgi:methyl-accepting chemotaxis protein
MRIRWKIVLASSLSLIATMAVTQTVNMNLFSSTQNQVQQATEAILYEELSERLLSIGSHEGEKVSGQINRAMESARSFGSGIEALRLEAREQHQAPEQLRPRIINILTRVLANESRFLATYTAFEPNALDNADDPASQLPGQDGQGRFVPYVYRTPSAEGNMEPLLGLENQQRDANGIRAGEYYLCPKESKRACLIDPYLYPVGDQEVLLTSLVTPIMENGKFLGIAGVDLPISFIQKITEAVSEGLYEGDSTVVITSHVGIVAGHSAKPESLGKGIAAVLGSESPELLNAVQEHRTAFIKTADRLMAVVPFNIGDLDKPWTITISVPVEKATAPLIALNKILSDKKSEAWAYSIVLTLICIVVAVLIIAFVAGRIVASLNHMTEIIREIAKGEGDLTQRVAIKSNDEIGQMAGHVNAFIDSIHKMVGQISTKTLEITQDAEASQAETAMNATRMNEQQTEIDSVVTAFNEMNATSAEVARSAAQAAESAGDANAAVVEGSQVVDSTVDAINTMAEEVSQAVAVIQGLEQSSESINEILSVIKGISEQTNLLALNAAIEAARAGEQGRGFAVVADEVRNLAHRSHESAEEIQSMIETLRLNTAKAVQTMGNSQEHAQACVGQAHETSQVLNRILQSVGQINDMNAQIASAAEEQSSVSNHINESITSIGDLSKSVHTSAESISKLGQGVSEHSTELGRLVRQFKL